jgi:geranylgeranyl diphosphate synthase type II
MKARLVAEKLEEYGAFTRSRLFEYLPRNAPGHRLYDLCAEYPLRGGRALRPSMCIAAARVFGGDAQDALCTAVSIELMHNAMLIHDDIEDESELRRGLPALHVRVGIPIAVNVGDLLSLISMRPLIENRERLGVSLAMQLLDLAECMARESAEGQAIELQWRSDNPIDVTQADYLRMVLKKTCWLTTIYPLQTGALIGSRGRANLTPILRFAYLLGSAFQIQDDLLNLVGDEARYGKELGGDIYEGKRSLMLIRLFAQARPAERERLSAFLALRREKRAASEVKWIRGAMDGYECITYARKVAQGLAGAARHEFAEAFGALPDSSDKAFIAELPTWVIERA